MGFENSGRMLAEALVFLQESWWRRRGPVSPEGLYVMWQLSRVHQNTQFSSSVLKPGAGLKLQFYRVALQELTYYLSPTVLLTILKRLNPCNKVLSA